MTQIDLAWPAVRSALKSTGDEFADLVASADNPLRKATADWTVADTAAHVTTIALSDVWMVGGHADVTAREFYSDIGSATIETVGELNDVALRHFDERRPQLIAGHLRDAIDAVLASTSAVDPHATISWLGGAQVTNAGLLAHLLNELQIHGRDIARAQESRWSVRPQDAAHFFELFLVGMISNGSGRLVGDRAPARRAPISVNFRSRYTTPVTVELDGRRLSTRPPGRRDDVTVRFDPVALNLVMFRRLSRVRAATTGGVVVWGRRPWLLPAFLHVLRMP